MYEIAPLKYEQLTDEAKAVVDYTCNYFADQFDNNEFGPFIEEVSYFNKDRVSSVLEYAINDVMAYCLSPYAEWSLVSYPYKHNFAKGCLQIAMIIEVIRHYIISYVEIPDTSRLGAPDVIRRDYLDRWKGVLQDYQNQLKDMGKKLSAILQDDMSNWNTQTLVDFYSLARGGRYIGSPSFEKQVGPWWC